MAGQAGAEVASLAAAVRSAHAAGRYDWVLPPERALPYDALRGEVYVGGVYVRLFLKSPHYALRDPGRFAEALLERLVQEAAAAGGQGQAAAAALDRCLLLSAGGVALLQGHPLLADHAAQLGYVGRLLTLLAGRCIRPPAAAAGAGAATPTVQSVPTTLPPDELGGCILRLLHQLAASSAVGEAMAAATGAPLVPTLLATMAWGHGATILVLETLKRALGQDNRQRDMLVAQALRTGLPQRLLTLLDWRSSSGGSDDRGSGADRPDSASSAAGDPAGALQQEQAVQRALAVDVLRLLAVDGAHSDAVGALLLGSPVWAAYADQRHDMFLPSGATPESGVVGLLTAGDTARFALPAPESVARPTPLEPLAPGGN